MTTRTNSSIPFTQEGTRKETQSAIEEALQLGLMESWGKLIRQLRDLSLQ